MSDHEIVTQHFDDPIGSFMHVNGKCYVKVSNKTDTIDTPIDTSQTSVYYKDMSHCHDDKMEHGIKLCPPKNALLFTVNLTESVAVMSFDIPSQSVPPTSVVYNPKPAGFSRVLARASAPHDTPYIFPTQERDITGALREKIVLTRITTRATLSGESPATNDVISKMLHK